MLLDTLYVWIVNNEILDCPTLKFPLHNSLSRTIYTPSILLIRSLLSAIFRTHIAIVSINVPADNLPSMNDVDVITVVHQ